MLPKIVLYSRLAFYSIHWAALEEISRNYAVQCIVIANTDTPDIPAVHRQLGSIDPKSSNENNPIEVRVMPKGKFAMQAMWLLQQLNDIHPYAIWVQEEPTDKFLMSILAYYRFSSQPKIVTAVCENIFKPKPVPLGWWWPRLFWQRLNGLLCIATASLEGIYEVGMPKNIPAQVLVAGAISAPKHVSALILPFIRQPGDFVVGFAGRIVQEKGWKVLLQAIAQLPHNFKCVLAGSGNQQEELATWLQKTELKDRVFYMGLLPKAQLWQFYKAIDCLAVPSLTFPRWKEQFGGVIADALCLGLPIIGSDSGAIPEVIGTGGCTAPEGDATQLAEKIHWLQQNPIVYQQMSMAGIAKFKDEYAIPVYAKKIAHSLNLNLI